MVFDFSSGLSCTWQTECQESAIYDTKPEVFKVHRVAPRWHEEREHHVGELNCRLVQLTNIVGSWS